MSEYDIRVEITEVSDDLAHVKEQAGNATTDRDGLLILLLIEMRRITASIDQVAVECNRIYSEMPTPSPDRR